MEDLLRMGLDILNIIIREEEMMEDLMDEEMGDDIEKSLVMLWKVIEDREEVESDEVRELEGLKDEKLEDEEKLKKEEKVEGSLKKNIINDMVLGKIENMDDDIEEKRKKILRKMWKRVNRDRLYLVKRGRK